jgi:predicted permease
LVVLGAFFYTPPSIALEDEDKPKGIGAYIERKIRKYKEKKKENRDLYPGENRTVFVACVSRMIVVPLIFLPLLALLARYDPFTAAKDPIFILCAVLLVSSPTALTLAQLTQAANGDAFERLISKMISISYAVLTPPLTLVYVVIGLFFTSL